MAALRILAEAVRAERLEGEAAQAKKMRAASEAARRRHLRKLAGDVEGAWTKLEKLVEASAYDDALKVAVDLRDLAAHEGDPVAFAKRFEAMRKRQLRRRGFFDRWKRANAPASGW